MNTVSLHAVEELFDLLIPMSEEQRTSYFASHSELDEETIERARQLLEADAAIDLPELTSLLSETAFVCQREPQVSDRLGPYSLVRRLGSGGMGVVFKALRQDGEICLPVALKVLHAELRSPEFLHELRREAATLATVSHPHIARLLDWKLDQSENSYFVLEFIEGESLIRFAETRNLITRERLELFLDLCSAVAFAHQHLIAHLDIKPANILVTHTGDLKLLDFGIACKLAQGKAHIDSRAVRAFSERYASPEQASGGPLSICSDIFSLGVVLRELLSVCPETTPDAAAALPEEIEAILRRAAAEKPEDRYPTVEELTLDLRNYLAGRPVAAMAQTRLYRLRKFCQRNFGSLMVACVCTVALAAGLAAWQTRRMAQDEHRRADRLRDAVHQLSTTLLFPLEDEMRNLPGATPARMMAVRTGLEFLQNLSSQAANDPKLAVELAKAYTKLGDIQGNPANSNLGDEKGARASYETASRLLAGLQAPDSRYATAVLLTHFGDLVTYEGSNRAAMDDYARAISLFRDLVRSRYSEEHFNEAFAQVLSDQGDLQRSDGKDAEARKSYAEAISVAELAIRQQPESISYQRQLARYYSRFGDLESDVGNWQRAEADYRSSFAVYEHLIRQHPDNLRVRQSWIAGANNLAYVHEKQDRPQDALQLYTQAEQMAARTVEIDPNNTMALRDQQVGYSNMTRIFLQLDRLPDADRSSQRELELADRLWKQNQQSALAIDDLAGSEEHRAEVEHQHHRYEAALMDESRAVEKMEGNFKQSGSSERLLSYMEGLVRQANYALDLAPGGATDGPASHRTAATAMARIQILKARLNLQNAEEKDCYRSIEQLETRMRS